MHARRVRPSGPETRAEHRPSRPTTSTRRRRTEGRVATRSEFVAPDDLRRTVAAAASALLPGLGQLINGRTRLARWFVLPILAIVALVVLQLAMGSPARLVASLVSPTAMSVILVLNVVILGWRLVSVAHAFFDGRYPAKAGRMGVSSLALVLLAVAIPHGLANAWGSSAQAAMSGVFVGQTAPGSGLNVAAVAHGPGHNERLNVLVFGSDTTAGQTEPLTDPMVIVSLDPVGATASLITVPSDITKIPLGNGSVYGPTLRSLLGYAESHPATFPQGGIRALEDAVGALLGIPIHAYARIDLGGFIKLVDTIGGIEVTSSRAWSDPGYDFDRGPTGVPGFRVTVGRHHLDGWAALAFGRAGTPPTESDVTRAARQQAVLLAIRDKLLAGGSTLVNLPRLLDAASGLITTDLSTDRLPDLVAIIEDLRPAAIYRLIMGPPLLRNVTDPALGPVRLPDLSAVRSAVKAIAPAPGQTPVLLSSNKPAAAPTTTTAPPGTSPGQSSSSP